VIGYLFRRLLATIGVLVGMSLITFALVALAPGDPAATVLEQRSGGVAPSAAALEAYRRELGLDAPAPVQYFRWLGAALRGDLGTSYRSSLPVAAEIAARLPATLTLALAGMAFAILIGVPLGTAAALRPGSMLDQASRLLAAAGTAMPGYVLALLLIWLFSVALGWLPAFGAGSLRHLVLPSIALAAGAAPPIARLTRAAVLDALDADHVRTARAKGLHERRIVVAHVLRNALIPIVTALGISAGNLLGGAVIIEQIFSWPGVGKYAVDAIFLRDYPVIQGVVLYLALVFAVVNLLVDLIYSRLDPTVTIIREA
jgi:peptide/nickel transport system permease protein